MREFRVKKLVRYIVTDWSDYRGGGSVTEACGPSTLEQANALADMLGAVHPGSLINKMEPEPESYGIPVPEPQEGEGRFRKKPVVIDAVAWNGATLGLTNRHVDLTKPFEPDVHLIKPDWLPPVTQSNELIWHDTPPVPVGEVWRSADVLWIGTLEGVMKASPGDWIIRGVKGKIYPCKPDIFAATYEQA